jgi:hypothetical protein
MGSLLDAQGNAIVKKIDESHDAPKEVIDIEVGKFYALMETSSGLCKYCRVDFIEMSKVVGNREVGLMLLERNGTMNIDFDLDYDCLNLANPKEFMPAPNAKVIFCELPKTLSRAEHEAEKIKNELAGN